MSGLQLKSNPQAGSQSGAEAESPPPAAGPPPLPPKAETPSANVPPPPPPQSVAPVPPSPTFMEAPEKSGNGAAKAIVWLVIILAVNGIGFGIYWFMQGGLEGLMTGALEELGEQIEMLEEETFDTQLDPEVERAMYEGAYQIDWPVLVLSGMVAGNTDEKTSAILNGNLVSLKQGIDGATLIEVRGDGVVLQYDRTRKYIRVGEST